MKRTMSEVLFGNLVDKLSGAQLVDGLRHTGCTEDEETLLWRGAMDCTRAPFWETIPTYHELDPVHGEIPWR